MAIFKNPPTKGCARFYLKGDSAGGILGVLRHDGLAGREKKRSSLGIVIAACLYEEHIPLAWIVKYKYQCGKNPF